MKKILFIVFSVFVAIMLTGCLSNSDVIDNTNTGTIIVSDIFTGILEVGISGDRIDVETGNIIIGKTINNKLKIDLKEKEIQKIQNKIAILKENNVILLKNFSKIKDDFSDITTYSHTTFGTKWPNRKTIVAKIIDNGYVSDIIINSNYYNNDWLFHTYIGIKSSGDTFESNKVLSNSKLNIRKAIGNNVYEMIKFVDQSQEIIKFITKHKNDKIIVRFYGDKFIDDLTLSENDKNAIYDTFILNKNLNEIYNLKNQIVDFKGDVKLLKNGETPSSELIDDLMNEIDKALQDEMK